MFLFHATNHLLIFDDIDWFPLVGISTALIFLEPDWPARFWNWLRKPRITAPEWNWFVGGAILMPVVGAFLGRPQFLCRCQHLVGRLPLQHRGLAQFFRRDAILFRRLPQRFCRTPRRCTASE